MTEITVVTPEDWQRWREARLRALADAPYAFGSRLEDWTTAVEERWRERLGWRGSHNLLATVVGNLAGMASGLPGEDPELVEVISFWVAPEHRGRGVGEALLGAVEAWARDLGALRVALDVVADNRPAVALYERRGFVVVGEAERGPEDDGPVELRMVKDLLP